uniref:Uncharacterized protein n=1 Tax=Ditylenchus dipsaci TaxID=166011 RepID=A0A915EGU3_9BILA
MLLWWLSSFLTAVIAQFGANVPQQQLQPQNQFQSQRYPQQNQQPNINRQQQQFGPNGLFTGMNGQRFGQPQQSPQTSLPQQQRDQQQPAQQSQQPQSSNPSTLLRGPTTVQAKWSEANRAYEHTYKTE